MRALLGHGLRGAPALYFGVENRQLYSVCSVLTATRRGVDIEPVWNMSLHVQTYPHSVGTPAAAMAPQRVSAAGCSALELSRSAHLLFLFVCHSLCPSPFTFDQVEGLLHLSEQETKAVYHSGSMLLAARSGTVSAWCPGGNPASSIEGFSCS